MASWGIASRVGWLALLCACGGGGDDDGGGESPHVVAVTPADLEESVAPDTVIEATFSESMDPSTLDVESFQVAGAGAPRAGAVTYDDETRTARLTLERPLALLVDHTVTISTAVTSSSGVALAEPESWTFRVRDGSWSEVDDLATADGDAEGIRAGLGAPGDAIAVWVEQGGDCDGLVAARFQAGAGWSDRETLDAGCASVPDLAVSAGGAAVVAWSRFDGIDAFEIVARRHVPATGWAPEDVQSEEATDAPGQSAALDRAGNAIVAWHHVADGVPIANLATTREADAESWSDPNPIGGDAAAPQTPAALAMSPDGDALAAWAQPGDGDAYAIWTSRARGGDAWSEGDFIETGADSNAFDPSLTIDASGAAVAVWTQYDGGESHAWAGSMEPDGTWQSAGELGSTGYQVPLAPLVAGAVEGGAIAVWIETIPAPDDGELGLWASIRDAEGWGAALRIDESPTTVGMPSVAIDGAGHAIAVWGQPEGSGTAIVAARFRAGLGWTPPAVLASSDTLYLGEPQVAVDQDGRAIAVWTAGGRVAGCAFD